MPACHVKGPFSVRRPLRELQPGPPLNLRATSQPKSQEGWAQPPYQMTTSSVAAGFVEGKNLNVDGKRDSSTEDLCNLNIPKEELSSLVGSGRYWNQSSIRLADVKLCTHVSLMWHSMHFSAYIDIRDVGAVHNKFWSLISFWSVYRTLYAPTLCGAVQIRRCTLL